MPLAGCLRSSRLQQLLKLLAVFRRLDRVHARPDDRHAGGGQRPGQIQRRLPAELHNHAVRLHTITDVQHVFGRQRLEEQQVARVVVRTDRFRIRVDHDRLDAEFAQRETGVAAAVVELDALPDPIRPAAENHDPLPVRVLGRRFVLVFVGRVVVGRVGFEFGRTRIDRLERRLESPAPCDSAALPSHAC